MPVDAGHQSQMDGLIADHIMVGGWAASKSAEEQIAAMESILSALPAHIRGRHTSDQYTTRAAQASSALEVSGPAPPRGA